MSAAVAGRRRDAKIVGVVSLGHFLSHFYQMALPPLFPFMNMQDGFSFTQLGLMLTLFYAGSALFQTPAGFLVDRHGARPVLLLGLGIIVGAFIVLAVVPYFPLMALCALIAGLGNSVFHPADYSILNATVGERRMGRAFSLHHFGGFLGYAAAPLSMAAVAAVAGWRAALVVAGVLGVAIFIAMLIASSEFADDRDQGDAVPMLPMLKQSVAILLQVPILLCFLFLGLIGMGQIGLQTFSPTVLELVFGLTTKLANSTVTILLIAVPAGILAGGFLAERVKRHEFVTCIFYGVAAATMLAIGLFHPPLSVLILFYVISGFTYGVASPSRDMVIRATSPKGAAGRVFGFVYSGLDFGSTCTPILFGFLVDIEAPRAMYFVIALLWVLSILIIFASRYTARRALAAAAAAQ